jgi:peptidoglycan-associated lipoprotein
MSQGSSQMSSGNISSKIIGPQKETKEVMVGAGVVLLIGGLLAAAWLYSKTGSQVKASPASSSIQHAEATDLLKKTAVVNQAVASTTYPTHVMGPVASIPAIFHTDIYFEVGRRGLTDEGKAQLSAQAPMLKQHADFGVLIQGYTDQQGSASYNKQLGMKRAVAVKAELVSAGIAEHQIQTVSLGEEGVLCVDGSDVCRHMNRRVHLEVRKIGQEHMVLPPAPVTTSEPLNSPIDSSSTMEDGDSTTESIPPALSDPMTPWESVAGS